MAYRLLSNRRSESTVIGVVFLLIASMMLAAYMVEFYDVYTEVRWREDLRSRERIVFPGLDEADSQHRIVYMVDRAIEAVISEETGLYEANLSVRIELDWYTARYLALYYRGYVYLGGTVEHTIYLLRSDGGSSILACINVSGSDRVYGPYTVANPAAYIYPDGSIRVGLHARSNQSFVIRIVSFEARFTGRIYGLGFIQVQNTGDVTVDIVGLWEVYRSGFRVRRDVCIALRPGESCVIIDKVPDDLVEVKVITRRGNTFIGRVKG